LIPSKGFECPRTHNQPRHLQVFDKSIFKTLTLIASPNSQEISDNKDHSITLIFWRILDLKDKY